MQVFESFKILIIIALCILFSGLWFLVWKWPQGKHMSFSQHAAAYRHTYFYYIGLFLIVLPLLLLFFIRWFVPVLNLSKWFIIFISLSAAAQIIVVLIPDSGGRKSLYHRAFAGMSAAFLLPALAIVLYSETVSPLTRTLGIICFVSMLLIIAVLIQGKGKHKSLLLLQLGYFVVFFSTILAATYIR